MGQVEHREMRNSGGEILLAVTAGETVEVTKDGRIAALIVPPPNDPVEQLLAQGRARRPSNPRSGLHAVERVRLDDTAEDVLDDVRKRC